MLNKLKHHWQVSTRREFFSQAGSGLAAIALASLMQEDTFAAAVDTIAANVGPQARTAILQRDSGMTAKNVVELAMRPVEAQRAALQGVHPAPLRKYTLTTAFSDRFRSVSGLFSP